MSTDYFLVSPSERKSVMVGSNGFSGPLVWSGATDVVAFVRWAIENNVEDIVMMNEYAFDVLTDSEDWPETVQP